MDNFANLPESCISEIISFTSPIDASVFCVLSKQFKSASESDTVWNKFLPSDIEDIISRSSSNTLVFPTKKDLFLSLTNSPIQLYGGTTSFSLDKKTGKKCIMVSAAPLLVPWLCQVDALFQLTPTSDICKTICSQMLSAETHYSSYLVYKFPQVGGNLVIRSVCRFVENESREVAERRASLVSLDPEIERDSLILYDPERCLLCFPNVPRLRSDGYLEVEIGTFFNDGGNRGDVESRVFGKETLMFVVKSIEFRPEVIVGREEYPCFPEDF